MQGTTMGFQPASTLRSRTYLGLIVAQFLAAFNDQCIHASAMFYAIHKEFLTEAQAAGMIGLAGHRSVGGIRASLYNAVDLEACETLASFLNDFALERAPGKKIITIGDAHAGTNEAASLEDPKRRAAELSTPLKEQRAFLRRQFPV